MTMYKETLLVWCSGPFCFHRAGLSAPLSSSNATKIHPVIRHRLPKVFVFGNCGNLNFKLNFRIFTEHAGTLEEEPRVAAMRAWWPSTSHHPSSRTPLFCSPCRRPGQLLGPWAMLSVCARAPAILTRACERCRGRFV